MTLGTGQLGTPGSFLAGISLGAPFTSAAAVDMGPVAPHCVISLDVHVTGTIDLSHGPLGSLVLDQ